MCLQPRSCKSVPYNWSYGAFKCFSYPWTCHWPSFLAIYQQFWSNLKTKLFHLEYCEFFYVGKDGSSEFPGGLSGLGFLFGVVDTSWVEPPKCTPSTYKLSIGAFALHFTVIFIHSQDTGNSAIFWHWGHV